MKVLGKILAAGLVALGVSVVSSTASAATISFGAFESTNTPLLVTPTVSVNDDLAGLFEVTVGIDGGSSETGLLSGIFFDLSSSITQSDISGTPAITNFDNNTKNVGGGVNLNGGFNPSGEAAVFDVGFRFAQTDISTALVFTVSDLGGTLALADWTRIGLRFQSVTTNGEGTEGSDKLIGYPQVSVVPLPAGLPLYAAGLAVLGFFGWRRRNKV